MGKKKKVKNQPQQPIKKEEIDLSYKLIDRDELPPKGDGIETCPWCGGSLWIVKDENGAQYRKCFHWCGYLCKI